MAEPSNPEDAVARTGRPPADLMEADLVKQAARNPGGSVAEIDQSLIGDPDGYIPGEAIRGVWTVDDNGQLTGEFEANPRYGPPQDDFTRLTGSDHWLAWLGDDPAGSIRRSVAGILDEQVPGTTVRWMKITDDPRYLTVGRRTDDDPTLIVTAAALAAAFAVGVDPPSGDFEIVWGVYSVAVAGLDHVEPARSRVWFDLWTGIDEAERQLQTRLAEMREVG